jgi:AcrR family transcriptional regulator
MVSQSGASSSVRPEPRPLEPVRLGSALRRNALLDAAVSLVRTGGVEAVSMDTVAERAGVSRPLVYKHFANRGELLGAVYQREAAALHAKLAGEVSRTRTLEEMYRTLIRGLLQAAAERGHVFAALRAAGGRTSQYRDEKRARDARTVQGFSARAMREYGLEGRAATKVTIMLLSAIDTVLAQWRRRPTPENAALLEEAYVGMVLGGYAAVAPGRDAGSDSDGHGPVASADHRKGA